MVENATASLAERWTRRLNRQMPEQFWDDIPQPLTSLPPSVDFNAEPHSPHRNPLPTSSSTPHTSNTPSNPIFRFFCTTCNLFGLSRRYYSKTLPSHNLEENLDLVDQSDMLNSINILSAIMLESAEPYHPYPNRNSLLLGKWY